MSTSVIEVLGLWNYILLVCSLEDFINLHSNIPENLFCVCVNFNVMYIMKHELPAKEYIRYMSVRQGSKSWGHHFFFPFFKLVSRLI
jgi:hypothetical protein